MAAHLIIAALALAAMPGEQGPLRPGPAAGELTRRTYEVVASGGHAFAATTAGLAVYDIADAGSPRPVATLFFPGSAGAVGLSGDLAFLSLGPEGLRILDLSRPDSPRQVGSLDTDGSVNAATPAGPGRLVIADGVMGLKVVDIGRPASPRLLSSLDTGAYARHLSLSGDLVAVAEEESGVRFLRIDASGRLSLLSSIRLDGSARGVTIESGRCLVAAGPAGLVVLDVTRPERPVIAGTFPSADYARGVAAGNGRVLLADGNAGLRVIEMKGVAGRAVSLRLLAAYATVRPANRVSLHGRNSGLALVAEDSAGIRLFELQ